MNDRSYAIKADASPGIVLSQTSALMHPGSEFELSVNDNTGDAGDKITRTSSNPEVATIDEYGKVKAIAPGQAVLKVSNGKSSAICVVAVEAVNTEVKDFNLSVDAFSGLKPDGEFVVKVTDLQPADVELNEIRWSVSESDEYTQYGEGLISVSKETDDGLSGCLYLTVKASQEDHELPAGDGTLTVTLNGVSRTMDIGWDKIYKTSDENDLISAQIGGEQTVYVKQGETAQLSAKYRQASQHSVGDVLTELNGLQLDGPDFFAINGGNATPYTAKLVNEEGYALPESIHVYTVYDYGTENEYNQEMTDITSGGYYGYTYNAETGELSIPAPSGATNKLKIVAEGTESAGNPAGEMSGTTYTRPDSLWGPFDWTVTEGSGTIEMVQAGDDYNGYYEAANYTPSETGISNVKATTKDGQYSVNFAVVSEPVKPDTLELDKHEVTIKAGETAALTPSLTPAASLEKDQAVSYTSFDPSVATIDENGVITGVKEGYAYIKAYASTNNKVMSQCIVHVEATPVSKVTLDQPSLSLKEGATATLKATVEPANATDKTLIWASSNADLVSVDKNGKVTAKKAGHAVITATAANGVKGECKVTVTKEAAPDVAVTGVSLNKKSLTLAPKKTATLTATVAPKNATNKTVTWKSSNTKVATVKNGKVTAKAAGTAKITVKTANGKTATCKVTVKVAVKKVKLSKTKVTLGVKEKLNLKATITPKNATNKKVTWKSSNKKVAAVSSKGMVTAKKTGKATITATVDGKKVTCKVTVKKAPTKSTKVTLNKKKVTLKVKKSFQIKAKVSSKYGSNKFLYTSSNKKVAKVSSTGKVTALKKGTATITVKTFNKKAKATIKITVK